MLNNKAITWFTKDYGIMQNINEKGNLMHNINMIKGRQMWDNPYSFITVY